MINDVLKETENHMKKTVEVFKSELSSLRTGRASISMFDSIKVDYYGSLMPINQLATISSPDATLVTITPFDASSISAIEKAILTSDMGLNPNNDGKMIRVPIPPLTEERRKSIVKKVHEFEEKSKVAIRNIRRDSRDQIKELEKEKMISEDDEKKGYDNIQKLTDKYVNEISEIASKKEKDIMHV
jgi:ribosome recycling factor